MKFVKIIGNISEDSINKSEEILTQLAIDVCINPENLGVGSRLGGHNFSSMLLLSRNHILTEETASVETDGDNYYWNPEFVISFTDKIVGLRPPQFHLPSNKDPNNEKLASYIAGPIDLDSFEKEYPQYADRVNKMLGITSNGDIVEVSQEEIDSITETFTSRFDVYIVSLMAGAKFRSYANEVYNAPRTINYRDMKGFYPSYVEDVRQFCKLTTEEDFTVSFEDFSAIEKLIYSKYKTCIFFKFKSESTKELNEKIEKIKPNLYKFLNKIDYEFFYITMRTQIALKTIMIYNMLEDPEIVEKSNTLVDYVRKVAKQVSAK
jgi:hypothetical protein